MTVCMVRMQLADFGLTRVLDVDKRTHISTQTYGTVAYMPPGAESASCAIMRLTKTRLHPIDGPAAERAWWPTLHAGMWDTLSTLNSVWGAELLSHSRLTRSADVYSFGMMMWELFTGEVGCR